MKLLYVVTHHAGSYDHIKVNETVVAFGDLQGELVQKR